MKYSHATVAIALCALLALAAAPACASLPEAPFAYADLTADGVPAGATVVQALALLGEPLSRGDVETEAATGAQKQTFTYDGLTLTFADGLLTDAALAKAGHAGPRGLAVGMAEAALDAAFPYDAAQVKDGVRYAAAWVESLALPLPPCAKALTYDDGTTTVQYLAPVAPYGDDVLKAPEAFLYEAHAMLTVTLDASHTVTALNWRVGALAE
jgi:hypothetical protein